MIEVGLLVAEHGSQDVDAAAGEGQDGLPVALPFAAFAEGPQRAGADQRDPVGDQHRPKAALWRPGSIGC